MKNYDNRHYINIDRLLSTAKSRKIKLSEVCKSLGLHKKFFYSARKNRIDDELIYTVAKMIDVSPEYLIGDADEPEPVSFAETLITSYEAHKLIYFYSSFDKRQKKLLLKYVEMLKDIEL